MWTQLRSSGTLYSALERDNQPRGSPKECENTPNVYSSLWMRRVDQQPLLPHTLNTTRIHVEALCHQGSDVRIREYSE